MAAVLLATQLFLLGVQQRSKEIGLYRALGLGPRLVRQILFREACVLAAVGTVLGAALGLLYTRAILFVQGKRRFVQYFKADFFEDTH